MTKHVHNQTVTRMLDDPDKCIDTIPETNGGILTRIFRKFLINGEVSRMRWSNFMDAYVRDVEAGKAGVRANMVSVRGNTTKFLADDSFTWENFIKALRFLQTVKLRIIIERTDTAGRVYTVEEVINFNKYNNEPVADETTDSITKDI